MRIVEPQHLRAQPEKKRKKYRGMKRLVIVLFAVIIAGGYYVSQRRVSSDQQSDFPALKSPPQTEDVSNETDDNEQQVGKFRTFTGNEFRLLYDNLLQPDLDKVDVPPVISGNDVADTRIRQIATARGYRLRSSPSGYLVRVDGHLLQTVVDEPWQKLQSTAARAGYTISIVSGYRSVDDQRQLFLSRLSALGATIQDVVDGLADEQINTVLVTTSIPGYSKHHTGYTIDITCAGFILEDFKDSPCHGWMTANNYENAKQFGFIPSYPADADLQGPEPEAWEYVWVGTELLEN